MVHVVTAAGTFNVITPDKAAEPAMESAPSVVPAVPNDSSVAGVDVPIPTLPDGTINA